MAKTNSKKQLDDSLVFIQELVYILNHVAGQATLWEIQEQEACEWIEPEPLTATEFEELLDQPISYDPIAWSSIDTQEEMLACRDRLRPLVDSWLVAGSNIQKWSAAPQLSAELGNLTVRLYRTESGTVGFRLVKPSSDSVVDMPTTWAVEYMFRYITSPLFDRIAQCKRCNRYFARLTQRADRKFCSGKCGRSFHAVRQRKEARGDERQAKLKEVRIEIKRFQGFSVKNQAKIFGAEGIKKWLAKRLGKHIRTNFITRAVKRGELQLPPQSG